MRERRCMLACATCAALVDHLPNGNDTNVEGNEAEHDSSRAFD